MRSNQSLCLLCKKEKAEQRKSHIVPKFISKSILGDKGHKRAYLIGTDREHKAPEFTQDSAKEDFILCLSCEKYFSIVETYISTMLHNRLWHIKYKDQFTDNVQGNIKWKTCNQVEPTIFRLFIYSIVWRCSISSVDLFSKFSLKPEQEEMLRKALSECKHETQINLLSNISSLSVRQSFIPFVIYTSESFSDRTSNFITFFPLNKTDYRFFLNEYSLIFTFGSMMEEYSYVYNSDDTSPKIVFLTEEFWKRTQQEFTQMYSERATRNLMQLGELQWIIKKKLIEEGKKET